jgi:hypothetical protein
MITADNPSVVEFGDERRRAGRVDTDEYVPLDSVDRSGRGRGDGLLDQRDHEHRQRGEDEHDARGLHPDHEQVFMSGWLQGASSP